MHRFLLSAILIVICSFSGLLAQQEASRVMIEGSAESPALVATFTEQSVVYGSMRDMASSLNLGFYRNTETGKIELKTDRYRLKATPDNPFVVVTDVFSNAQSIYQLPVNVIAAGNDLFVPMQYFAAFLDIVLPSGVEFMHTDRTLAVAKPDLDAGPDITAMEVEERANGYLIRLRSRRPIKDFSGFYRDDGWFYLTLVGARIDTGVFTRFRPVTPVRKVVPVLSPTSFQLSLQLNREIHSTDIFRDPNSNDLIIALHKKTDPGEIAQRHLQNGSNDTITRERDRWKLDVIVIDPGHGGKDPGTIGVRGTKEKDVTLGISLKLGEMIKKRMPDTKVVFTREKTSSSNCIVAVKLRTKQGGNSLSAFTQTRHAGSRRPSADSKYICFAPVGRKRRYALQRGRIRLSGLKTITKSGMRISATRILYSLQWHTVRTFGTASNSRIYCSKKWEMSRVYRTGGCVRPDSMFLSAHLCRVFSSKRDISRMRMRKGILPVRKGSSMWPKRSLTLSNGIARSMIRCSRLHRETEPSTTFMRI
jgi:N-acetylmuramoyl-L-alanine amidase